MDRRLTTVLAADIVGYSGLMDHDREGAIAALKSFREETLMSILAAHNGTLIKSMGDGWIVEFLSAHSGASGRSFQQHPVSHSGHPVTLG